MSLQAIFGLGVPELLIILAVVLLLFGGSRLAGLGKSTGRALKEFKEETKGLKGEHDQTPGVGSTLSNPYEAGNPGASTQPPPQVGNPYGQAPQSGTPYGQPPQAGAPYQAPQDGTPGFPEHDVRRDG